MVNTNIQGPIPLAGRGLTYDPMDTYSTGEYPICINMLLNKDGGLEQRPSIVSVDDDVYGTPRTVPSNIRKNPRIFLGKDLGTKVGNSRPFIRSGGKEIYSSGTVSGTFFPNGLTLPPDTPIYSSQIVEILYFFNKFIYVVQSNVPGTGAYTQYSLHSYDADGNEVGLPVTATQMSTEGYSDLETYHYVDSFVFKDRIWVVHNSGVYFSKAADHTDWSAPEGGFFLYDKITGCVAVGDTIYIFCENEIHALTYNDDPNTNSTSRIISNTLGGYTPCVHEGTVYFLGPDHNTIYAISGLQFDKVFDLTIASAIHSYHKSKMVSYENYLVILYYELVTPTFDHPEVYRDDYNIRLCRGLYFFDLEKGFLSQIEFRDQYNDSNTGLFHYVNPTQPLYFGLGQGGGLTTECGYVIDIAVHPESSGKNKLYFLTSRKYGTGDNYGFSYYYNNHKDYFTSWMDRILTITGFNYPNITIDVLNKNVFTALYIKNFTPDGSEFLMKKFRNLLIQGILSTNMSVNIIPDGSLFSEANNKYINTIGDDNPFTKPFAYRFGINQRMRSISLFFKKNIAQVVDQPVEISIINTLWTYTARTLSKSSPYDT